MSRLLQRVKDTFGGKGDSGKPDNHGLRVVNPALEDAAVDIVAVHGLARGFKSWAWGSGDGSTTWLEDPLPRDLANNARIITYSYNPDALSYQFLIRKIIYGRALDLVQQLKDLRARTRTTRRPLVFLAHSLGGLIVKRVLIISHEAVTADEALRDVELSTCGIAFFGTPDSGVSADELEKIIRKISKLSPAHRTLGREDAASMRSDTAWLQKEMEAFKPISAPITIISFQENEKTPTSFHSRWIVQESETQKSALVSIPGRPHDPMSNIKLEKRHTGLVNFAGPSDPDYPRFLQPLRERILKQAIEVSQYKWQRHDKIQRALRDNTSYAYLREDFTDIKVVPWDDGMLTRLHLLDELTTQLETDIDEAGSEIKITTLYGNEGVGKTTLARRYARSVAKDRNLVWCFNAESRETLVTGYLELAARILDYYARRYGDATSEDEVTRFRGLLRDELGLPDVEDMLKAKDVKDLERIKVASAVKGVKDWLLHAKNRWLLVFDNIDSSFDLMEFLPLTLHGIAILVTRDRNRCSWATSELCVPDWTEDEAADLLVASLTAGGVATTVLGCDDPAVKEVVRALQYHPALPEPGQVSSISEPVDDGPAASPTTTTASQYYPFAISCAAKEILQRKLSPSEFAVGLRHSQLGSLALAGLDAKVARGILTMSAMLSSDAFNAIPTDLFAGSLLDEEDPSEDLPSEEKHFSADFSNQKIVDEVLAYLASVNIVHGIASSFGVRTDQPGPPTQFLLPSSARDEIFRDLIPQETQRAAAARSACYFCVQAVEKQDDLDEALSGIQEYGRVMLPHAKACYGMAGRLTPRSRSTIRWQVLGNLCMTQGADAEAIGCFSLALDNVAMDGIERTRTTLSLATLYYQLNDLAESRNLLGKIDLRDVPPSSIPSLTFRIELAKGAESAAEGHLEQAKETYDKLEKDQESNVGAIHHNTILAVQRLADTLKALGRLEDAEALYRRVFTACKIRLGLRDPFTLEVAEELGQLHQLRGSVSRAEALYELCLDVKRATLGDEHPSTAATLARLATLMDVRARWSKADEFYARALGVMERALGACHPTYVATLEDHALSHRMRSWRRGAGEAVGREMDLVLSERMYRRAVEIKEANPKLFSRDECEASLAKLSELREQEELSVIERERRRKSDSGVSGDLVEVGVAA